MATVDTLVAVRSSLDSLMDLIKASPVPGPGKHIGALIGFRYVLLARLHPFKYQSALKFN